MKKVVKFGIHNPKMMVRLSIVVVVAVAAVARAESEAELAYSPEELQGAAKLQLMRVRLEEAKKKANAARGNKDDA